MSGNYTRLMSLSKPATERPNARTPERANESTPERANATPQKAISRKIKRHSYEFYEDQIQELKRRQLKQLVNGKDVSLSAMVRQALDEYLQKQDSA